MRITASTSDGVTVQGDDNLLEYVETTVEAGALVVRVRPGYRLQPSPEIDVDVSELDGVSLTGSGDVVAEGVDSDVLALAVTGSGDLTCSGAARRCRGARPPSGCPPTGGARRRSG